MLGQAAGKHTRAELRMRAPRSRALNIRPQQGGVTLHWGGAGLRLAGHRSCIAAWRGWQDFHMDTRGWVDIAYTMGFCQHGWVFPGRGYGVRTAANGSNRGNDVSYAFCHLNEAGSPPSPQALAAAAWLVADARLHGGAGKAVWAHSDWYGSDCPGPDLRQLARALHNRPVAAAESTEEENMATPEEIALAVWNTPAPTGELGTDEKPLTMGYVLMRAYQAAQRIEVLERAEEQP